MQSWCLNVYSHGSHAQGIKLVRHYGADTTPLEASLVSITVNMSLRFGIVISIERSGNW
jgi:predicted flavoprotein YhiN